MSKFAVDKPRWSEKEWVLWQCTSGGWGGGVNMRGKKGGYDRSPEKKTGLGKEGNWGVKINVNVVNSRDALFLPRLGITGVFGTHACMGEEQRSK